MKHLFTLGIALLATGISRAQDTPRVNTINEVVISTSRMEKEASNTPRSVTVINAKQIEASNVKTLPELLAQVEGLYILGNGMNPGSNLSIFTRGTNSNQTAIMLDGIPVTDPSSPNNAFDINDLTLNNIERIEIVRGSNSSLYGSGAIGGSINIITKGKGDKPFEGSADFRFGSNVTYSGARVQYNDKRGFFAGIGLNNISSKGFDAAEDDGKMPVLEPRDKDGFNQTDLIGRAGYENNKLMVMLGTKLLQKSADIDAGPFKNDNNYTIDTRRNINTLLATYKFNSAFSLKVNAGYSTNSRTTVNDSSLIAKDTTDHTYFKGLFTGSNMQGEVLGAYSKDAFNLVAGIGTTQERMNSETHLYINDYVYSYFSQSHLNYKDSNLTQQNIFAFFHADYDFSELMFSGLNLSVGGRYNKHSQYGSNTSFEISPSFTTGLTTFYYSLSNGFLTPSLYQQFVNDPSIPLIGNKWLKPQKSRTSEVGFKTRVTNTLTFTGSAFTILTEDIVQYVNLWNKKTPVDSLSYADFLHNTYINCGTMKNQGLDLSVSLKASDKLSMAFRYGFCASQLLVDNRNLDTVPTGGNHVQLYEGGAFLTLNQKEVTIARRPSNSITAIANYTPASNLSLRLDARYVSSRYDTWYNPMLGPFGALDTKSVNGYTLMDFYAKYFFSNHVNIGLKIDNLLNTKYTEVIGYRTRGTSVFVDLQVKL